jgi:thiamine-monophosphate kinase
MYSEASLIEKIRQRFPPIAAKIGIGDDAAEVGLPEGFSALLCSDLLAENSHFQRETYPPDSIGYKAIAVNVSDIGAMGGVPTQCLLSLALPADIEEGWVDEFLDGISAACRRFDVELVGGDSSSAESIFVDVSMMGRVETGKAVRRNGAREGDLVYVTGNLGGSSLGLSLIDSRDARDPAVNRHLYPEPRHRVGRQIAPKASAMIDLSDGLSVDLGHILTDSCVSARIERDRIPCYPGSDLEMALHGGEDYELIITGTDLPDEVDGVGLTRIGEIVPDPSGRIILVTDTAEEVIAPGGWQHFSQ